jgi:hypothetical protein
MFKKKKEMRMAHNYQSPPFTELFVAVMPLSVITKGKPFLCALNLLGDNPLQAKFLNPS